MREEREVRGVLISQFQKSTPNGSNPGADRMDDTECMVSAKCVISFEGESSFGARSASRTGPASRVRSASC